MASKATIRARRQKLLSEILNFPSLSTAEYEAMVGTSYGQLIGDLKWLQKQGLVVRFRNKELDRLDRESMFGGKGGKVWSWYWRPADWMG